MDVTTIIAAVAIITLLVFAVRFGKALSMLEQRISDLEDKAG